MYFLEKFAKPHFYYKLNISKTELYSYVWNYDILERSTLLEAAIQLSEHREQHISKRNYEV
jgi:hypothetical protein